MISLRTLPLRNATYHAWLNLPVLLGVAVGAAVLAGALIVGDSLRGSLRDRALRQLNGVESAYVGNRLIRESLADDLPRDVVPALFVRGSILHRTSGTDPKRLTRINFIALGIRGWRAFGLPPIPPSDDANSGGAILSSAVADALMAKAGDDVEFIVESFSTVPRSSLLGRRGTDDVTRTLKGTVGAILPASHRAANFNLSPDPSEPLNVFVPLNYLQTQLNIPGKANALLAFSGNSTDLNHELASRLTLADWGLRVAIAPKKKAYISVESEHLVLDPPSVVAVEAAARAIDARSEKTLVYLANAISFGTTMVPNDTIGDLKKLIPYSMVAALNPAAAPPLGPFLPPGVNGLANDEIALADWPDSPLTGLKTGDFITLTYYQPEMEAGIAEASATFKFKGYVPFTGAADDPDLTPPFPGITDRLSIRDWNSPFPLNRQRIRSGDANERYWDQHKTTPKAYITLARGEQLWGSRFGTITSIRVASAPGKTPPQTAEALQTKIRQTLDPNAAGLQFEPTRERAIRASQGGTDFAVLLLLFCWLLIATALLLVGLLFRLAMERRAKEVGILLAVGYSVARVRWLLLLEGVVVASIGAFIGLALAVGYARFMIDVLTTLWPDAEVGKYLTLHVKPLSLVIGFVASILVAAVTIWFSIRGLAKVPPPALLGGVTAATDASGVVARRPLWVIGLASLMAVVGAGLLIFGGSAANPDQRSMAFFSGGGLLLVAGLLIARFYLRREPRASFVSRGIAGLIALGMRNAGRNPTRSLLTATLIAFATFLIVSVESFRRKPDDDFLKPTGGSGGFRLIGETDVPVFQRFDTGAGRDDMLDRLQEVFQRQEAANPAGPSRQQRLAQATEALSEAKVIPFRLQGGDDASCLNLFQAGRPRVLGVPDELIERGGFQFAETRAVTDSEKKNPWHLLQMTEPDGAVPVLAEQNTALFMLKTPVGGTLTIPDESGAPVTVRIVGTLQDSVFQSELLMSDANFRKLYPRQEGFRVFLIDTPPGREMEIAHLFESGLSSNGFAATRTTDRVAAYQAVIGAYLTTFQLLGGFALLLAVLGLGVVIMRSVWERAGELALLRAIGYRTRSIQTLILSETLLVLLIGLGIGMLAAILSVLPNLALGGSVPWTRLAILLVVVSATGLAVAGLATASVARAPLIPALRKD